MTFNTPPLQAYALACAVLVLNLLGLAVATALSRTKAKVMVNSEDGAVIKGAKLADADAPNVRRAQRAHRNAIENIVPFFAIGMLYAMTGPTPRGAWIYFGVFVAARLAHSVAYLAGAQPWRTASWAVGALATIGMVYHVIRAAL